MVCFVYSSCCYNYGFLVIITSCVSLWFSIIYWGEKRERHFIHHYTSLLGVLMYFKNSDYTDNISIWTLIYYAITCSALTSICPLGAESELHCFVQTFWKTMPDISSGHKWIIFLLSPASLTDICYRDACWRQTACSCAWWCSHPQATYKCLSRATSLNCKRHLCWSLQLGSTARPWIVFIWLTSFCTVFLSHFCTCSKPPLVCKYCKILRNLASILICFKGILV